MKFGLGFITLLYATSALVIAQSPQQELVNKYCVTCHNQKLKTANLTLDNASLENVGPSAATWEKVVRKLHGGTMPPPGMPRPEKAALEGLANYLETSLDKAATSAPNPGRAALHRLNRSEYANAIRDLLGLEINAAELLPGDDEANGFDNIADVLKVSPLHVEAYLGASRRISALAVGDPSTPPVRQVYRVQPDLSQERHIEGLPLGTRGGTRIVHNFPLDGEYDFSVFILRNIVGYMTGLEFPHQLEIAVDGNRVFTAPVGGDEDLRMIDANLSQAGDTIDGRLKARVPVKAGAHVVTVAFLQKSAAQSDEPLQPFTRDLDLQNMNGVPLIDHLDIAGPYNSAGPGDTISRRLIFTCKTQDLVCARQILSNLARKAYRRPVTDEDTETLLSFYQAGRNQPNKGQQPFEAGVQNALRMILANPKFIYRTEAANIAGGRVSDLELASRLSFFLWSSIPDETLLTLATQGKLHEPAVLDQQVKRMLADSKSRALTENFAGQWLFLRNLKSVLPDSQQFPNWDDNLRQSLRKETELFFDSIVREDHSVLDLITADYTFVNERVAKHYGMPNIYGSQFRRVRLTDHHRRGLLGQGSVLAVTSYPNRTSVVLRGKWILENVLGTPPGAPPPNVPALKENTDSGKQLSMRQLMEAHRANPTCAACHRVMDPYGFALENFDATGAWRVREAAGVIDASTQLADGTKVEGPQGLREMVMSKPQQFAGTVTEKMLTYALGRGLDYYDMPVVRGIVRDAAKNNYKMSSIILGIVHSRPFQMRQSAKAEGQAVAEVRR